MLLTASNIVMMLKTREEMTGDDSVDLEQEDQSRNQEDEESKETDRVDHHWHKEDQERDIVVVTVLAAADLILRVKRDSERNPKIFLLAGELTNEQEVWS